jgi:hypothetical protein
MFRALLAHPQEVPHKCHLVYYVRVMSVGCTRIDPGDHPLQHIVLYKTVFSFYKFSAILCNYQQYSIWNSVIML